jgi:hypothetical protein
MSSSSCFLLSALSWRRRLMKAAFFLMLLSKRDRAASSGRAAASMKAHQRLSAKACPVAGSYCYRNLGDDDVHMAAAGEQLPPHHTHLA